MNRRRFGWRLVLVGAVLVLPVLRQGWFAPGTRSLVEEAWSGRGVEAAESPVTFSRQIGPILYRNCAVCHHPGGSGPFSLLSYQDARRRGTLIESVTQSRYMPPWLPAPGHGEFAESRRLPEGDIALIKRWVDSGMPQGDLAEAPPAPVFSTDWELGPPDLILHSEAPFQVPASGTDVFQNLVLPVSIPATRYVRAMQIKPGAPQVVHHANLLIDRTASVRRAHPADWKQGVPGMEITVPSGDSFDPDSHFLFWKPDSAALVEPEGMPWRLDPGNDLVLNLHLKPTGKPEAVDATIGLYFAEKPAVRHPMLLQLEHDGALDIPPGDASFVVEDELVMPVDVDALGIYPHAHYLGKKMEGYAILPGSQEKRWLILIEDWDIDRQSVYRFAQPIFLPRGTVIHMRYTYDNSAANIRNPNHPPLRVKAGNRSVDEMGHLWLQVLPREGEGAKADPRALLEETWMKNRLRKSPADHTALYNLASVEMTKGEYKAAVDLYRKALVQAPNDSSTLTAMAVALDSAGDGLQARAAYQKALVIDPEDANARFDLARLESRLQDYPAAEAQLRQLLQANAKDPEAHAVLGAVLAVTEREDQARQEFAAALAVDPDNFDALYNLASLEATSGNLPRAAELLRKALAQKDDAEAHQLLGGIDAQSGKIADALGEFKALQRLRPGDAAPHLALAKIFSAMGEMAAAIAEQQAALNIEPANPGDWNDLGVLHVHAGDRTAARQDFEHALKLDPHNEAARANLGRL